MENLNTSDVFELFAIPMACSLASHAALADYGLPYRIHYLGRGPDKRLADGTAYAEFAPLERVAVLRRPDGTVVRENMAVLTAIDRLGGNPGAGSEDHLAWLSVVATELHKQVLYPFFDPQAPTATKRDVTARCLPPVLTVLDSELAARPYLGGEWPAGADYYLLWALLMVSHMGTRLHESYPALSAFKRRMRDRAAVAAVIDEERRAYLASAGS